MAQGAYVVAARRTAIGRFGGALRDMTAVDLGEAVVRHVLEESGIPAQSVDSLIFGQARQAGSGPNPARQVACRAGIPHERAAFTVNMACASGLKAIALAAERIGCGRAEVVVCGGMESLSRQPYVIDGARFGEPCGNHALADLMYRDGYLCPLSGMIMGETAEKLARIYGIPRREQDVLALESQRRVAAARDRFVEEIAPVTLPGRAAVFDRDEHPRPEVTMDDLQRLPPVFSRDGTVTAGNSSGITDGAAALVLASERTVQLHGLATLARVGADEEAGVDPSIMGMGLVPSTRALLARTGLTLDQIDLVELNEAFAAQVLACLRELPFDPQRLNVNGGSIALGHPSGCTGARIAVTLLHEMRRRRARLGLATLCVSGGLGMSMLFEGTHAS